MFCVLINKKILLDVLIKFKHVIGKDCFLFIFQLIKQNSGGLNLEINEELKRLIKNFLYSLKRSWFVCKQSCQKRLKFLAECKRNNVSFPIKLTPQIEVMQYEVS